MAKIMLQLKILIAYATGHGSLEEIQGFRDYLRELGFTIVVVNKSLIEDPVSLEVITSSDFMEDSKIHKLKEEVNRYLQNNVDVQQYHIMDY